MPIRAILVCYACGPGRGSEPQMSWSWINALADAGVSVTALVSQQYADTLNQALAANPSPLINIEYVNRAESTVLARLKKAYVATQYLSWQRAALKRARELHEAQPFDVAHHFSYGSVTQGTLITELDIPSVAGPLGGGQYTPKAFRSIVPNEWRTESLRGWLVRLGGRNPLLKRTATTASIILASNLETKQLLESAGATCEVMLDDGNKPGEIAAAPRTLGPALRLVWVGRIYEFKGLDLALDALAKAVEHCKVSLIVCGDGPGKPTVKAKLAELVARGIVTDFGWATEDQLTEIYEQSDAILYTSLRDNGGAPLHKAARTGLPAIVLDHQGPGAIVSTAWGLKVQPISPAQAVADLASEITRLANDPQLYERLSAAALVAAHDNEWPARAKRVVEIYESLRRT